MKKQSLLIGAVGAVTALGFCTINVLPAIAESANVTINVTVRSAAPSGTIISINDGDVFYNPNQTVEVVYTDAETIEYKLVHKDKNGVETTYSLPTHQVSTTGTTTSGTDSWTIDLDSFGGYGDFTLTTTINGNGSTEDSVSFRYEAFKLEDTSRVEAETNNPILKITAAPEVKYVIIQVYDKNDKSILVDPEKVFTNGEQETEFVLNLAKAGVPGGDYKVVATPYNASGNIVTSNRQVTVTYDPNIPDVPVTPGEPEVPEVPDTGGSIFAELNLSNSDFTSAFLVLFVAALIGGVIVLKKTSQARK